MTYVMFCNHSIILHMKYHVIYMLTCPSTSAVKFICSVPCIKITFSNVKSLLTINFSYTHRINQLLRLKNQQLFIYINILCWWFLFIAPTMDCITLSSHRFSSGRVTKYPKYPVRVSTWNYSCSTNVRR